MIIKVDVFNGEWDWGGDWPGQAASGFMAWFNEKLSSIPTEFLESAKIEIKSAESCHGGHDVFINIYYYRPETEDEILSREDEARKESEVVKKRELEQLAALTKKYL